MRSEDVPVLKSDLFLAAIMLGTGLFSGGLEAVLAVPVVAGTIGALIAAAVSLAEHDVVPGVYPEVATVAAFLATVAVGAGFVFVLSAPTSVIGAAALTGGGVGVAVYRLVFGVLLPVPAYRLEKDEEPEETVEPE
ncbi:hypothetical protein [Haloarcula onubensis]|uniref:Holin n=1 Tax=Haloarcula onubensis TaxID=2950539 RepID=A0ABU2FNT9_9EURY|nr:hypothetical protein [Halomicroarcula sp. S3CR25-11]MDS0281957.1 hypothetical protein [Halomicroarcula sp. S3CR25-11]